jgi:hypothetical protein
MFEDLVAALQAEKRRILGRWDSLTIPDIEREMDVLKKQQEDPEIWNNPAGLPLWRWMSAGSRKKSRPGSRSARASRTVSSWPSLRRRRGDVSVEPELRKLLDEFRKKI